MIGKRQHFKCNNLKKAMELGFVEDKNRLYYCDNSNINSPLHYIISITKNDKGIHLLKMNYYTFKIFKKMVEEGIVDE